MQKTFDMATYDIVAIYDYRNANPNGDPDNFNAPRQNSQGNILVSGESLRARMRNAVAREFEGNPRFDIFHRRGIIRDTLIKEAYEEAGALKDKKVDEVKGNGNLCKRYWDIRTFGFVSTGTGKGNVRGPVTLHLGQSVYPAVPEPDFTITNCTTASEKTSEKNKGHNQGMGRKVFVSHTVVPFTGTFDAKHAETTGFTQEDLQALIVGFRKAYSISQSQGSGCATLRKLFLMKHSDPNRNCQPQTAYDLIKVRSSKQGDATCWEDYEVVVSSEVPEGLEIIDVPVL